MPPQSTRSTPGESSSVPLETTRTVRHDRVARWLSRILFLGWMAAISGGEAMGFAGASLPWGLGFALVIAWKLGVTWGAVQSIVTLLVSGLARRELGAPADWVFLSLFVVPQICLLVLVQRTRHQLQQAETLARIDYLTQVANRAALLESIDAELGRSARSGQPLTLLMLDCDGFKRINDRLGHARGDAVLVRLARALQENLRKYDLVARLGGDEFVMVLAETDLSEAETIVERLRANIHLLVEREFPGLTVTIGVVVFQEPLASAEACLDEVDRVMYSARTRGKSQTEFLVHGAEVAVEAVRGPRLHTDETSQ